MEEGVSELQELRIYIPTYRRTEAQHTYGALPDFWKARTTFVCDGRDWKILKIMEGLHEESDVLLVPSWVKTIAQKRAFILQNTRHVKIVMMDDDLRFAARTGEGVSLRPATPEDVHEAIQALDGALDTYAHAGFSARQGNNHLEPGWKNTARMMYVLGYRPQILRHRCALGRIEHREDFDYTLQLLRQGFDNMILADVCVDQRFNAPGGCSEQRTMEASNADAKKLAELHPGLVKVVEKDYKTSVPRLEVRVSWKKALNHDEPETEAEE